jgi:hypothetical protein
MLTVRYISDLLTFVRGPPVSVGRGQLLTIRSEDLLIVRRTPALPALAHSPIETPVLARLRAALRHRHCPAPAYRHRPRRHAHKRRRVRHNRRRTIVDLQLVVAAAFAVAFLVQAFVHVDHDDFHAEGALQVRFALGHRHFHALGRKIGGTVRGKANIRLFAIGSGWQDREYVHNAGRAAGRRVRMQVGLEEYGFERIRFFPFRKKQNFRIFHMFSPERWRMYGKYGK